MSKHYEFKQAIRVGRHTFPLGIRQVPAEIEAHPHFKNFLKAGSVRIAGSAQTDKQLSDLPVLPPPSSEAAKRSKVAAEAVQTAPHEVVPEVQLGESEPTAVAPEASPEASPDAEIGGEEASEDDGPRMSGRNRKGKGK